MDLSQLSTDSLKPGTMVGVEVKGKPVLVANVNGQYYAIGNVCTHMGCTVSDGKLTGDRAQCPCHGSTFDVKTGAVLKGPAKNPEPSFKVTVSGKQLVINA